MVLVQKQPGEREGMNVEQCPLQSHPCILRKLMMQNRRRLGEGEGERELWLFGGGPSGAEAASSDNL